MNSMGCSACLPVPWWIWWRQEKPGAMIGGVVLTDGGEEHALADLHAQVVMLVAERAGHAAAAGIDEAARWRPGFACREP